jgi:transcriptional regulator with XRE-family HTH domain
MREAPKPDCNQSPIDIHLGRQVTRLRETMGHSLESLSVLSGIDAVELRRYEIGALRIGAAKLFKLATALQIPVPWFFEGLISTSADVGSIDTQSTNMDYEEGLAKITDCFENVTVNQRQVLVEVAQAMRQQRESGTEEKSKVFTKKSERDI